MLTPGVSFGKSAKDFFREGERLLKSKDPFGAYNALAEAVKLDAKNKKYQRTFEEAARLASDGCFNEATAQISANPRLALERLKWALDYNPENKRAAEVLAALESEIGQVKRQIEAERQSLDLDRVEAAGQALRAALKYQDVVPEYALLEADVSAAQRLLKVRTALGGGDLLAATSVLRRSKLGPETSDGLGLAERSLRSATLAEAGRQYSASKPGTLSRARAAAILQSVSDLLGPHENADGARAELLSFLDGIRDRGLLPGQTPHGGVFGDYPRVLVQALQVVLRDTAANSQVQAITARLRNQPRRSIRLRLRAPSQPSCSILSVDALREYARTLDGVALTDGDDYEVAISLNDLACQETDNPRVSVRLINSTYVAGQSQSVNPEYAQLQAQLDAARIELSRSSSTNPVVLAFIEGRMSGLARRLSQTPPFVYQDIEQAYQLQEYVAKRQVYIKAGGTYLLRVGAVHGGRELTVEADRSTEDSGRAGALPQDRRYSNRDPQLKSFEALRRGALDDFERGFRRQLKQALCDQFALIASDETVDEMARMDATLRLTDGSDETTYANQSAALVRLVEARLLSDAGTDAGRALHLPPSIQKPDLRPEPSADQTRDAKSEGVASMIERILDGVVAIETDTGSSASGFFASKDCQVLTNNHVISGSRVIIVKDRQRRLYVGEVSGTDADRDLALIRTKSADCRPLGLDRAPSVRIADEVFAVGSPLGLSGTVTKGIVSSVRRIADGLELFQIDAALNPGNSGGPLISRSGRVVGINTFKLKGFENLNFAVSTAEAFKVFGGALNGQ